MITQKRIRAGIAIWLVVWGVLILFFAETCLGGNPVEEPEVSSSNLNPDRHQAKWRIGLGAGLLAKAEETAFSSVETPYELFFDYDLSPWIRFRIGYSRSFFGYDYDQFVSNGTTSKTATITNRLETEALYLAYRYTQDLTSRLNVYAAGGLAYMKSELTTDYDLGGIVTNDHGNGMILLTGGYYRFGDFGVGGQVTALSRKGNFSGADIHTGSSQVQLFLFVSF